MSFSLPLKAKLIKASTVSPYLVIVFHGSGDRPESFKSFPRELGLRHMNFLLVQAPRAYLSGFSWYPFSRNSAKAIVALREKIDELVDQWVGKGFQEENIFIIGHSQGAHTALQYSVFGKRRLGGVMCSGGYLKFPKNWRKNITNEAKDIPLLFTHGTKDDIVKIQETRENALLLSSEGFRVRWIEIVKGHELDHPVEIGAMKDWLENVLQARNVRKLKTFAAGFHNFNQI